MLTDVRLLSFVSGAAIYFLTAYLMGHPELMYGFIGGASVTFIAMRVK